MEIAGQLSRIATYGEWGRATLETASGETWAVVGKPVANLTENERYRFVGDLKSHPKYGQQFEVREARTDAPDGVPALVKFLERTYGGCGPKTAAAIVEWYRTSGGGLEKLRSAVSVRPWELEQCPALGARKIAYIDASGASLDEHVYRRLAVALGELQISDWILRRLSKWLFASVGQHQDNPVEHCWSVLASDPYKPVLHVDGYGFALADAIGRHLKFGRDHPARLAALGQQAVQVGCEQGGHVFLTLRQAEKQLARMDPSVSLEACLDASVERGFPVEVVGASRVYPKGLLRAETFVSEELRRMLAPSTPIWASSHEALVERIDLLQQATDNPFQLDDSQRAALLGLLTSHVRIHTLTAGPGCGKTAVMEMVAGLVQGALFAAPTGIAAKVLTSRIQRHGVCATTTHMMLEANGDGFRKCRTNQLVANVIVLDEGGMQDLLIFASVLDAMSPSTHLIVVGDENQLESIGPGQVLADLLAIEEVDHHRLTVPHRNSGGILELLASIARGEYPEASPGDEVTFLGSRPGDEFGFDDLLDVWLEAVNRQGLEQVGLLFGHRKGSTDELGWNVTYANAAIQRLLNPDTASGHIPGTGINVADRILVKRNLTLKRFGLDGEEEIVGQVVNGDTGYVTGFSLGRAGLVQCVEILLDEGRQIDFPGDQLHYLQLAYARTVHSAQGSEFAEVIFVVMGPANGFLNRRLLFTGASRPRQRIYMVGPREGIAEVARRRGVRRNSWVAEHVRPHRKGT